MQVVPRRRGAHTAKAVYVLASSRLTEHILTEYRQSSSVCTCSGQGHRGCSPLMHDGRPGWTWMGDEGTAATPRNPPACIDRGMSIWHLFLCRARTHRRTSSRTHTHTHIHAQARHSTFDSKRADMLMYIAPNSTKDRQAGAQASNQASHQPWRRLSGGDGVKIPKKIDSHRQDQRSQGDPAWHTRKSA